MSIPPPVSALPQDVQSTLLMIVKPKFDAYFSFTSSVSGTPLRSVPDPLGQPWFVYPDQTMIADLTFLWSLFTDVYEIFGGPAKLAAFVKGEPLLKSDFYRIVEGSSQSDPDGSFWHFPNGQVPLLQAADADLQHVLRTLRNGFAHSHWLYANLSALDYWTNLGWQTAGAPPAFGLHSRPAKNYTMYIVDAFPWTPQNFWNMNNLRIIVTSSHILRYHLHLFLNFILNGSRADVFHH